MIYKIQLHLDKVILGYFTSLQAIDTALEGKTYLGRRLMRQDLGIYREQGTMGILIADILPMHLDMWQVAFVDKEQE